MKGTERIKQLRKVNNFFWKTGNVESLKESKKHGKSPQVLCQNKTRQV